MTDIELDDHEKEKRQRRGDRFVLNATLVGVMLIGVGFGILASILLGGTKPKDVKITADSILITVDKIEERVSESQIEIADLRGELKTRSAEAEIQITRLQVNTERLEAEVLRLRDILQGQKDGTAAKRNDPNP